MHSICAKISNVNRENQLSAKVSLLFLVFHFVGLKIDKNQNGKNATHFLIEQLIFLRMHYVCRSKSAFGEIYNRIQNTTGA